MRKSDAVRHFGSQSALALALGITVGAVWQWKEELPKDRQAQIEILTGGELKADIAKRGNFRKPA